MRGLSAAVWVALVGNCRNSYMLIESDVVANLEGVTGEGASPHE